MEEIISIVVPVYKAEAYIAHTITMVRQQTYRNWELILVDDCSPDGSVEQIQKALSDCSRSVQETTAEDDTSLEIYQWKEGQRAVLLRKGRNEGAAAARNTGRKAAKGRYLAYLDADDIWLPEKLQKELAFLKERQAEFVFTAYEFGDEQANPTGKVVQVPEILTYRKALSRTVIFTTTVLFDREKIPEELLSMPLVESEDTATWWQILRAGYQAHGLNEVLAIYRRPAQSLSSNKLKAMKRIWNLYRRQEKLSVIFSAYYFIFWAYRATVRRL